MRDKAKQVFHPKLSRAAAQVAKPTTAILIMIIIIFYEDDRVYCSILVKAKDAEVLSPILGSQRHLL